MKLLIDSAETFVYDCQENETVADLKIFLAEREKMPLFDIRLVANTNTLENDVVLSTLDEMTTINVHQKVGGGKVHGSLARAGKVKNQTPKVEKQEKRKKPRGRAKRRMQYNRRFVNVVATLGRKKGPNSNAK